MNSSTRMFWELISLTPGFSPVLLPGGFPNRFNGLSTVAEAVETAVRLLRATLTGLKPGVNERRHLEV